MKRKFVALHQAIVLGMLSCGIFLGGGCKKESNPGVISQSADVAGKSDKDPQALKDFLQINLVGNNDEYHPGRVDPLLVNAWGLTFSPSGIPWISAEETGVSTVYNSEGGQLLPAVAIPSPGAGAGGHPTGVVFNGTPDFILPNGQTARFIFVGVDGVVSGWNPGNIGMAIRMVDNSSTAVYTGLAIGSDGGNNFLYAANFKSGKIDVFDGNWQPVSKPFNDPELPGEYAPFNIQAIGNQLFVMYAKSGGDEEVKHPGFGIVDVFGMDGSFIKRFTSNGQLNAPWGIAKAPSGFYGDGHTASQDTYLVGNFGDGRINAYDANGEFLGQLRAHGQPIVIEGLWAIAFPPVTATTVDPNRLYFAAGPDDEEEGLFGYITK